MNFERIEGFSSPELQLWGAKVADQLAFAIAFDNKHPAFGYSASWSDADTFHKQREFTIFAEKLPSLTAAKNACEEQWKKMQQ